jgi:DNA-binding MarR family transcriptional regulator
VDDQAFLMEIHLAYKPALGTTEVAERVGLSQQATSKRLQRLEEYRLVESDKTGNARVWWLTDDGRRQLDPEENDPSSQ